MPIEAGTATVLATAIAAFAAVIGAIGAIAAWRAAKATRESTRMQILLDFSKRDASNDMFEATVLLWEFRRKFGDEFVDRCFELQDSSKPEDREKWMQIDSARRTVHKFFLQLMQIRQLDLISEKQLMTIIYKHQLETVTQILQPLEAMKPGLPYTKPVFAEYNRLLVNYDRLYKKYFRIKLN